MPEVEKLQQPKSSQRKTALISSSFAQRREDIFNRLKKSAADCILNYSERKELATEKDETVAELCEAIEDTLSYGLRQQNVNPVLSAVSLFQNMQEIVTGNAGNSSANGANNDTTFWDFCQISLTSHERERYEKLKHVWTKHGRGKAFLRASLNENSLQRYLLTWINEQEILHRFYTPWSLLLNAEAVQLPQIIGSLDKILFALNSDTVELNVVSRAQPVQTIKEEPIIYAPSPVAVSKQKRRTNIVELPIETPSTTADFLLSLKNKEIPDKQELYKFIDGSVETVASIQKSEDNVNGENVIGTSPVDPIEPELAFLKEPLPEYSAECTSSGLTNSNALVEREDYEDKSDTSSQYSKSSSANGSANVQALEEKLREMDERCALLETRVAQLSLENRQLVRRLTQYFNDSGIDPSSSLATNFLITIPHVKLLKTRSGSSYYAYEIHITMRQHLEHWVLLRRYRDFYKLHKSLLHTHPSIAAVEFPPKKHFGNMNLVFVEERRQQLQIYLLNVVEYLPQVEACKSKAELQKVFPFLRER